MGGSMEFKVENIGMPDISRRIKLPLDQLKVGESFAVPCKEDDIARVVGNVRGRVHRYQKSHDNKIKFSVTTSGGEIRVYCIQKDSDIAVNGRG